MSKECTTHHFACDCREEKFKDMERENKQLRQTVLETLNQRGQRELIVAWDRAKELERENAALRERLDSVQKSHFTLSKDNAALRELTSTLGAPNHINIPVEKWRELSEDKERLDWVIKDSYYHFFFKLSSDLEKGRRQIDAARKEPRT